MLYFWNDDIDENVKNVFVGNIDIETITISNFSTRRGNISTQKITC